MMIVEHQNANSSDQFQGPIPSSAGLQMQESRGLSAQESGQNSSLMNLANRDLDFHLRSGGRGSLDSTRKSNLINNPSKESSLNNQVQERETQELTKYIMNHPIKNVLEK
jgi:hypothetical protein